MPNRFAVVPTDFALHPQVRAAGPRLGWTWFLVATAATACALPSEHAPRMVGAGLWPNQSWRCLGVSRRDVDRAAACGLLRWDHHDLVILGMGTRFDAAEATAGQQAALVAPHAGLAQAGGLGMTPAPGMGGGGMSEAARDQRRAAAHARWGTPRPPSELSAAVESVAGAAGTSGADAASTGDADRMRDAETDAEPDAETDADRIEKTCGPHIPSLSLPSKERQQKTTKTRIRTRAPLLGDAELHAESDAELHAESATEPDADIQVEPPPESRTQLPSASMADVSAWQDTRQHSWVGCLLQAGAKCGPKNWPAWKGLVERYGEVRVAEVASSIAATNRWPDRVEEQLRQSGGRPSAWQSRVVHINMDEAYDRRRR